MGKTAYVVAAGVATVAVGAAYYMHRRRKRAPVRQTEIPHGVPVVAPPISLKPAPAPAPAPQEPAPPTPEQPDQMAQREEAVRAKERGNKRFQGRQYQLAIEEYTKA